MRIFRMKSLLKWIGAGLGLTVLALVTALIILTSLIHPNQYKALIISEFKQFTGFEMAIPGDLSWSFFPHLGVEASEVTISDRDVFSAHLKNLVLRLRFKALLHKQLDLSRVSIETLQVNQLQASQVQAKVRFHDRILEIRRVTANLYQGNLNTEASVSLKAASPNLHVSGKLDGADITGLLQGLSGKTSTLRFKGRADLNWDLTTQGKKTDEMLDHLNGKGSAKVTQGA